MTRPDPVDRGKSGSKIHILSDLTGARYDSYTSHFRAFLAAARTCVRHCVDSGFCYCSRDQLSRRLG